MWRFIPTEIHSPALNMALDEACMNAVRAGKAPPTIRFYQWEKNAVLLGYFQSARREVDVKKCKNWGVDIIRRQTGGGAVYNDKDGEFTYSVIAPTEMYPKNIIESYKVLCGYMIQGLRNLGLDAQFAPINDILVNGKKISGNAQTRKKGIILHHGTLLCKVDVKRMFDLLLIPDEKIKDKLIKTVEERVTSIELQNKDLTFDQIEQAIFQGFLEGKEYQVGTWTEEEMAEAKKLAEEKYSADEWRFLR